MLKEKGILLICGQLWHPDCKVARFIEIGVDRKYLEIGNGLVAEDRCEFEFCEVGNWLGEPVKCSSLGPYLCSDNKLFVILFSTTFFFHCNSFQIFQRFLANFQLLSSKVERMQLSLFFFLLLLFGLVYCDSCPFQRFSLRGFLSLNFSFSFLSKYFSFLAGEACGECEGRTADSFCASKECLFRCQQPLEFYVEGKYSSRHAHRTTSFETVNSNGENVTVSILKYSHDGKVTFSLQNSQRKRPLHKNVFEYLQRIEFRTNKHHYQVTTVEEGLWKYGTSRISHLEIITPSGETNKVYLSQKGRCASTRDKEGVCATHVY